MSKKPLERRPALRLTNLLQAKAPLVVTTAIFIYLYLTLHLAVILRRFIRHAQRSPFRYSEYGPTEASDHPNQV